MVSVSTRPRALFLTPVVPDGSGRGIAMRAAGHLRALAASFEVDLVVLGDPGAELAPLPAETAALCRSRTVVAQAARAGPALPNLPPLALFAEIVCPEHRRYLPDRAALAALAAEIGEAPVDVLFCFRLRTGLLWAALAGRHGLRASRRVVDFDDVESEFIRRARTVESAHLGVERRLIERLAETRYRRIENRFMRRFDLTLVCSTKDRDSLRARVPGARIEVVANAVTMPDTVTPPPAGAPVRILFVGTMSYPPNRDGAVFFCEDVLPRLRARTPAGLAVSLVGFDPPPEVRRLGDLPDVTVTGGVDSVVPYYRAAHFVVAPIRYGGGTRIKILEALAHERAVVSTTIGAEGLDLVPEREILVADSADDFAEACARLIAAPDLRDRLARDGRCRVTATYDGKAVQAGLAALLARS